MEPTMHTDIHFDTLHVEALQLGDELALRFQGELTSQHVEPLHRHLDRLIEQTARDVSVDLGDLDFISINGLGLLTWLAAQQRARGRTLSLLNPSRHLGGVLHLTHLDRVLHVADEPALIAA
jgi:anti-anti-sigma factor